eukprot:3900334-Rhodomonas_salina.2
MVSLRGSVQQARKPTASVDGKGTWRAVRSAAPRSPLAPALCQCCPNSVCALRFNCTSHARQGNPLSDLHFLLSKSSQNIVCWSSVTAPSTGIIQRRTRKTPRSSVRILD